MIMGEMRKVRILTRGAIPIINEKGPILRIFELDSDIILELRRRMISVEDLGPVDTTILNTSVVKSDISEEDMLADMKAINEIENNNMTLAARRLAKNSGESVKIVDSNNRLVEKKPSKKNKEEEKVKVAPVVEESTPNFEPVSENEINELKLKSIPTVDADEMNNENVIENDSKDIIEKTEHIKKNNKYRNR